MLDFIFTCSFIILINTLFSLNVIISFIYILVNIMFMFYV